LTDATLGDRYKVRGFIGCGGMARVYLAEDVKTHRPVAVKVLEKPYSEDEAAVARFMSEATTVTQIGHPSIVSLLEAGKREEDGAPYLVMEFLYGESLGDYLRRHNTMPRELALPILRQTASALSAAHRKKIIHRDVKPDNLFLIGEPGEAYHVKVIDFGLSKLQTREMTAAGLILGTPDFMAPEQVLGEPVDARCDVYALGLVMYRVLTGRPPFSAPDEVTAVAHQVHTPAPPTGLEPRIASVIMTAIRKRPAERYPAMDIFFDDLGKLDDPNAKLWASPGEAPDDRYEPQSIIGKHVAGALLRALGPGDTDPLGSEPQ
jgi:serine/threonine-protein kinase